MTVLPSSLREQLRGDLAGAGFNRTVQYQLLASGTWGTATDLSAVVSADEVVEEYVDGSDQRKKVRRITVRPLADVAIRMGDRILYDSTTFTVVAISGTDVRRLVAEHRSSLGAQGADRFRNEGGN
jgi:hypothetical protein